MENIDFSEMANLYKNELLNNVIPFWTKNSIDDKEGGYFSCLDQYGNVFDTDKFVWLQARQVWLFAMLYNKEGQKQEWLDIALKGALFLEKFGHDGNYNWYFSLTAEGEPLVQPYNIFSNTFAAMAFSQLHLATGEKRYATIAKVTFERVLERKNNPKGIYEKAYPNTRRLKNFALPMILCNLSLEMEHLLDPELVNNTIETAITEVMEIFHDKKSNLILENVGPKGEFSNTFEGRLLNPGHAIEAMWFIMDIGERLERKDLINKAVGITLDTLEHSWDKKHGGIYYFMDINSCPPQQLEWDQKLWWVHIETLISLLKGYYLTDNEACLEWYKKVHTYTWSHFKDDKHSEWFGYLNRRGEVLLSLKGGKWKGCFHVPRGLYQCWKLLEKLDKKYKNEKKES